MTQAETVPLLSVIVPVRNDAPSVEVMVRVLSAMIDQPHEIIIVYDDLADTSIPIIRPSAACSPPSVRE